MFVCFFFYARNECFRGGLPSVSVLIPFAMRLSNPCVYLPSLRHGAPTARQSMRHDPPTLTQGLPTRVLTLLARRRLHHWLRRLSRQQHQRRQPRAMATQARLLCKLSARLSILGTSMRAQGLLRGGPARLSSWREGLGILRRQYVNILWRRQ